MKEMLRFVFIGWLGLLVWGCSGGGENGPSSEPLPILGNSTLTPEGGEIPHQVDPFQVWDQDSNQVSLASFDGKIFVADFFFTRCPSICPKMSEQMLRLHDTFFEEGQVGLISFSIDPPRDSVPQLRAYTDKLVPASKHSRIETDKWHLVTAEAGHILEIAPSFLVNAVEDEEAQGGYLHDGSFILVDKKRRIRGYYDGTKPDNVDELIVDIKRLLREG